MWNYVPGRKLNVFVIVCNWNVYYCFVKLDDLPFNRIFLSMEFYENCSDVVGFTYVTNNVVILICCSRNTRYEGS